MPLDVTIKCPHCGDVSKRDIDYQDMQAPFLAKCRSIQCKKYFAVKVAFTFDVECEKIFEDPDKPIPYSVPPRPPEETEQP